MNNGYHGNNAQPPSLTSSSGKIPPAVPPRSRDSSVTRVQYQTITSLTNGLATIKRNSLGRADGQQLLEEVFRASTLSRQSTRSGDGRIPFRREASVPRSGVTNWSDMSHGTMGAASSANWSDSLPRKDLFLNQTNSLPRRDKAGLGRPEPGKHLGPGPGGDTDNKPELPLDRSNPFRDAILGGM